MKKTSYILALITASSSLLLSSCSRTAEPETIGVNGFVNFSVPIPDGPVATIARTAKAPVATKAAQITSISSFKVKAWNNGATDKTAFIAAYTDVSVNWSENVGSAETNIIWTQPYEKIFYAYANAPESGATISSDTYEGQTLAYTVPADAKDQNDIIMAAYAGDGGLTRTASLNFKHPLTSVVFKLGSIDNVKSIDKISIGGVYASGSVTQGSNGIFGSWTGTTAPLNVFQTITADLPETAGSVIGVPFILIPQTKAEGLAVELELTMADETKKTCTATLGATTSGIDWKAGMTNSYTINYSTTDKLSFTYEVENWILGQQTTLAFAEIDDSPHYLCFSAPTEHSIYLCRVNDNQCTFEYSFDGEEWEEYEFAPIPLKVSTFLGNFDIYLGTTPCTINFEKTVFFRGIKETNGNGLGHGSISIDEEAGAIFPSIDDACVFLFDIEGEAEADLSVEGNILSLLDMNLETDIETSVISDMSESIPVAFPMLFCGLDGSSPLVDAARLELPSMSLGIGSYFGMFYGCSELQNAPLLPAMNLSMGSYAMMFNGCNNLTTAPDLPATTIAEFSYMKMFENCYSLKTAPTLPATTLAPYCYVGMFRDCDALETAPELPATTLAPRCYSSMFYGCSSLEIAPALPATYLPEHCYSSMFEDCASLSYIKMLATDFDNENCFLNMIKNVSESGTLIVNSQVLSYGEATIRYLLSLSDGWEIRGE